MRSNPAKSSSAFTRLHFDCSWSFGSFLGSYRLRVEGQVRGTLTARELFLAVRRWTRTRTPAWMDLQLDLKSWTLLDSIMRKGTVIGLAGFTLG